MQPKIGLSAESFVSRIAGGNRWSVWLLAVFMVLVCLTPASVEAQQPATVKFSAWKYLWGGPVKSLKKSTLVALDDFSITGANAKDPFLLNQVVCDGEWGLVKGAIQQTAGRSVAMKLAHADEFELEAGINAEGHGGWFLLVGYNQGHGYGVYNVNLRTSGSPWHFSEFRGDTGIAQTDREFTRYVNRGNEALLVRVIDQKLTVQLDRRVLLDEEDLPAYTPGDIILGTYDTTYGPRPLKILGIRIRERQATP